jgi:hypothetical protein
VVNGTNNRAIKASMKSELASIEEIFKKMEVEGFDTTLPLKWGFFFVNSKKENLQNVYSEMRDKGYTLESIEATEDKAYQLHVTKVDVLTPLKLHKRNIAFNELAAYCNVEGYDGWDVEKL